MQCKNSYLPLADDSESGSVSDEQQEATVIAPVPVLLPKARGVLAMPNTHGAVLKPPPGFDPLPAKKATPPRRQPTVCRGYTLRRGSQSVQLSRVEGAGVGAPTTSLSNVTFYGRCFRCGYMSHSQKFCPLSRCRNCGEFGHMETVCDRVRAARREGHMSTDNAARSMRQRAPTTSWRRATASVTARASGRGGSWSTPHKQHQGANLCEDSMVDIRRVDFPVADRASRHGTNTK